MTDNSEEVFVDKNKTGRYFRVTANINLDAIQNNINNIRSIIKKGTKIMAIIKADGYGHGAVPVAKFLNSIDVDAYGIAIIEEGIELREAGIMKPLLILGYTPVEQYKQLVEYNITQTIFQLDTAKALSLEAMKQNKVANIHLKIDTGMTRLGFSDTMESINEIKEITRMQGVCIEGIFTHFACADEQDKTSSLKQLDRFNKFIKELEKEGIHIPMKHISNSAGIVDFSNDDFNMVRSGIITYGYYPSEEVNKDSINLEPAMEIKTHVSFVKEVEAGVGISYGHTYVTNKKTKVATVPVGYADGYPRSLSSKGRVLIHGEYANIIGRVCMDQFMVDVSHIDNVKQGDIVTLIGKDKDRYISVEEVSNLAGSFNYEFICNVSKRVPRLYFREGKIVEIKE
jgi:alanine racemase